MEAMESVVLSVKWDCAVQCAKEKHTRSGLLWLLLMQTTLMEEPNDLGEKSSFWFSVLNIRLWNRLPEFSRWNRLLARCEQSLMSFIALDLHHSVNMSSMESRADLVRRSAALITVCRALQSWREQFIDRIPYTAAVWKVFRITGETLNLLGCLRWWSCFLAQMPVHVPVQQWCKCESVFQGARFLCCFKIGEKQEKLFFFSRVAEGQSQSSAFCLQTCLY